MTDLGNAQDDGKWPPDRRPVDLTFGGNISGCISVVSMLVQKA